jgi:hypothetical protein
MMEGIRLHDEPDRDGVGSNISAADHAGAVERQIAGNAMSIYRNIAGNAMSIYRNIARNAMSIYRNIARNATRGLVRWTMLEGVIFRKADFSTVEILRKSSLCTNVG